MKYPLEKNIILCYNIIEKVGFTLIICVFRGGNMKTVSLDALIPREDFDILSNIGGGNNTRNKSTLSIEDLKYESFFFATLRKPIFQRETNEWDPNKICGIIESFINSELIPSIILWRNQGGYIFVIDGAHRLSSLGAWINDDYGDGKISSEYYGNFISQEQKDIAQKTRELVNQRVGSFQEISSITRDPKLATDESKLNIAKNLGALAIQLQWVEGNADKAEDSFLKINQCATKISDAELELIENRNKAYAIAARAIVRAGKGFQYWSQFSVEAQNKILEYSKEIHNTMFRGNSADTNDINSFSVGGSQSSSITLDVVNQTVKICNDITDIHKAVKGNENSVIDVLKTTLKILQYINSKEKFSLGLHPFVYFYSDLGKHKIGSYYGMLLFTKRIIAKNKINDFISVRAKFEEVIYKYNFIVQQIIRKYRQTKKSYTKIGDYFWEIMEIIKSNESLSTDEVIAVLKGKQDYRYLQTEIIDNEEVEVRGNFSRGTKQQIKLQTFVNSLPKCPICGGYMDSYSICVDHIIRKADGGTNSLLNGQVTHLYCNTTFKN